MTDAESEQPHWRWEFGTAEDGTHVLTAFSEQGRFSLRLDDTDLMFLRDCAERGLEEGEAA